MRHRVRLRQSGWVLFGVLVVVVLVEGIALGLRSSRLHTSTSPPAPIGALSTTTITAMPIVLPVTTIPAPHPPVSIPGSLTYTVPAKTPITITTHQLCWVEAKTAANGRVLFEQLMQPGQTKSWTSPVWIRFGNPGAVHVTAGPWPLALPTGGSGNLIIRSP